MATSSRHDLIRNYINGEWSPARSGKTTQNIDPGTGESLGDVVVSGREEAEAAIAAAKAALPGWRRTPAPKRGAILQKASDLFAARIGGARMVVGASRVTVWGALAMALTAGVGALFGTAVG